MFFVMRIQTADKFEELAYRLLETYTLEDLLEMNDLEPIDIILQLLLVGCIDPETPTIIDLGNTNDERTE